MVKMSLGRSLLALFSSESSRNSYTSAVSDSDLVTFLSLLGRPPRPRRPETGTGAGGVKTAVVIGTGTPSLMTFPRLVCIPPRSEPLGFLPRARPPRLPRPIDASRSVSKEDSGPSK